MPPLLSMFAPLLVQIVGWLWDRVVNHYKSTAIGVAVGGAVYEGLTVFGCDPNLVAPAVAAAVVAVPKILGTDADKIAPTIWKAMKDAVEQKKKSDAVLAESQAGQDKVAKEAGIK